MIDRREFLRLMGASLALAGTSCNVSPPVEEIVPYVREPLDIVPGEPLFYSTVTTLGGYALGILVESHLGRPTKIEGNPLHPSSLGATDVFAQASVLSLYDPDRSKDVLRNGQISTWETFSSDIRKIIAAQRQNGGAGLHLLTETITSPTLAFQIGELQKTFPGAVWHQFEPIDRSNERKGAISAFGTDVETVYRFDKADVIVSLDADFLLGRPGSVRYARDFIQRRRIRQGETGLSRLYVLQTTPTITGAAADHCIAMLPAEIGSFAQELISMSSPDARRSAIIEDLAAHRGSSLVIAGRSQPPAVHAIAHAVNSALGNVGQTVYYTETVAANSVDSTESLSALVNDLDAGRVETLLVLGGNPVYNAPADLHFAESLRKAGWAAHLSLYNAETSAHCEWHLPATHELEMWSDARSFDGTASIIQPLIEPLFNGRSPHELLAMFSDSPQAAGYDVVRRFWRTHGIGTVQKTVPAGPVPRTEANVGSANANSSSAEDNIADRANSFEASWKQALRDGYIRDTAFSPKNVSASAGPFELTGSRPTGDQRSFVLIFRADPSVYDGRFANNGWLQEMPKPLTKLTWDNAALMSPATAERLGIENDIANTGGSHGQVIADVVELNLNGVTLRAPAFILPDHADNSITVSLGYGRDRAGQLGNGTGFNAYALRNSNAMWSAAGLNVAKTTERFSLACTQNHTNMEGRDLVRIATLAEYEQDQNFAKRDADDPEKQISLYPGWEYNGHAWGMAVDTASCIGCNACVAACQAENNIPVVGKTEVMRAREMHWIRIDHYYENGATLLQPVMCQHCENAPCELVCPVEATTHSSEGLNEMTYNRCVGTRYCSNNCPYKVRRFNFFGFADYETPLVQLQRNPQVTVRSRGVMEKCTYCVQRIQNAKIKAEVEGRELRDGEIVTACQQACPTEAIVFGDINDPDSRVTRLKREATNYGLLAELNTRPRTTYLATVRDRNEKMMEKE
ncbi:MAG: 4Fe-4S dicluster domain-containing protein [Acidobacteria bacterium]|nr:4Fe-4S dicluster domain-containing protein [Acidobacteriota bacterium]